ncbi:methionine aminopeptidase 1D [Salpingoeca rosetta]|uniref:Methionine aminopeptidase n=1 Tax=Salpingoeca rosetta (strain ATCC 50818 / BSB-021) TaxID=946362 RepID=F2TZ38_SALR5|nr:methionine aminopeptidase 1D [Salpingoeca rosetta]EGD78862.1 methionine aminopeptidase 1D [Salpingoeca rosetta]|eukprot:XP_004997818.1 methionine aminopeptidase 1D [Salpingoeca rosetta]
MLLQRLWCSGGRRCCKPTINAARGIATTRVSGYEKIAAPGEVSPRRVVPDDIEKPSYVRALIARAADMHTTQSRIKPLQGEMLGRMRDAGRLAADTLAYTASHIAPGVTTDALDELAHEFIVSAGAYPSPLGYMGFKKSICTSVNNVIVHGVPDDRELQEGDIINIDVTVFLNGVHGDTSRTFAVGAVDRSAERLIEGAEKALHDAIATCGPGVPYCAIGEAVEAVADFYRLSICPYFIGHGIGPSFHAPPAVLHYYNDEDYVMKPGHVFTIEPALNEGSPEFRILADEWTAVTLDGQRSAQAEHTVLITEEGVEVLTRRKDEDCERAVE